MEEDNECGFHPALRNPEAPSCSGRGREKKKKNDKRNCEEATNGSGRKKKGMNVSTATLGSNLKAETEI